VTQEGEAEWSIVADAVQPVFGGFGNLSDSVSAQVRELPGFHAPTDMMARPPAVRFWLE
jgi:hypothetical protein